MRSFCDMSTVLKPSPLLGCSDNFVNPIKSIELTRMELMIVKEQAVIFGHGWIFKKGVLIKIKLS